MKNKNIYQVSTDRHQYEVTYNTDMHWHTDKHVHVHTHNTQTDRHTPGLSPEINV